MILAAGLGTRLRPLTNSTPKALLLVNGRPLIYYSLKLLQKHGIREAVINLHYLGDLIQKEVGDGSKFGLRIHYSWEPEILGTGGGVKKAAAAFLEKESFLVVNSDVLIDVNLKDLVRSHRRKKAIATMVVRPRETDSSFTPVWVGAYDRVLSIGEEAPSRQKSNACIYTGIQVLEPRFLERLPNEGESCIIRQGYLPALERREKICGYRYEGYWNDLGTLDRLRQAESDLKSGRVRLSFL